MSIVSEPLHPIVECAQTIDGALKGVRDVQPVFMTPAQKESAVHALHRTEAALAELKLRVLAAGDQEWVQGRGHRDVTAWLASTTNTEPSHARAEVRLAHALDRRWAKVAAGMADGVVSATQARVIVQALEDLPTRVGPEITANAEAELVAYTERFRPTELRRIGRHILEVVAPEIAEAEEAKKLAAEEQHAVDKLRLKIRHLGDGTSRISGLLPTADLTRLETYLEAYTNPRHPNPHNNGDQPDEGSVDGGQDPGPFGETDPIPYHRKLGHAFIALLEHLDPARLPEHGGDATTLMVTINLDALRTQLATAGIIGPDLDHGPDLTAAQARRLACTAKIVPVVLGGKSEILDVGRARRLYTPVQRKAIRLRDKRCRAKGCRVKAQWTHIHHLKSWAAGGGTDLANGICLCHFHHHRIHDQRYAHQLLPDGDLLIHRRT